MTLTASMQNALASGAVVPRWLAWLSARNRVDGLTETVGLWTGDDVRTFTIDGEARVYHGAGAMIGLGEIVYEAGLNVQMQRLTLAILTPEVEAAIRSYDPRLAPVEVHLALFDPETNALIGTERMIKGTVDSAPINEAPRGSNADAVCEITIATSTRSGTRTLASKKSDSSQKERDANDRGREYADISGEVRVTWGEEG